MLNKIKKIIKPFLNLIYNLIDSTISPFVLTKKYFLRKKWLSETDILNYRKNIKTYDIFTFFNELDLLEIRLNILDKYVDYFVIVEATETFTGIPKKLFFQENKERFKKWEHKIIHHVINDTPKNEEDLKARLVNINLNDLDKNIIKDTLTSDNIPKGQVQWLKEFYQKESIQKALINLNDNDFCFVSDVDEIWNPDIIIDYSKNYIYKYKQKPYVYYLNNRSNENWRGWTGPIACKHKIIKNNCLNHLRTHSKTEYFVIEKGGWHFTFQGGVDKIRKKLESYGHQEINTEKIKNDVESVIQKNKDIRGRFIRFWKDEKDLPKYLVENKEKFKNLFK